MTRILGIDPGLASCGWALLRIDGRKPFCEASGKWSTDKGDTDARIRGLGMLFANMLHGVDLVALEAWVSFGEASKGWAQSTVPRVIERFLTLAELRKVPTIQVTTQEAKRAIGATDKASVRRAVTVLVDHEHRAPNQHAVDAIAAAVAGERKWRRECAFAPSALSPQSLKQNDRNAVSSSAPVGVSAVPGKEKRGTTCRM